MQAERVNSLLARWWCDKVAALSFTGFLWLSALAGALLNDRNEAFSWITWLLPVTPLVLDVVFSVLPRLHYPSSSPLRVSTLVAQAAGQWQVAGIVLFVLGFAWYGLIALWSQTTLHSVVFMAVVASVPVACMWLVVSRQPLRQR